MKTEDVHMLGHMLRFVAPDMVDEGMPAVARDYLKAAGVLDSYPIPDIMAMTDDELKKLRRACAMELMRRNEKIWECMDCKDKDCGMFILKQEIWESLGLPKNRGILCVECCAKRLGRQMTLGDLKPAT